MAHKRKKNHKSSHQKTQAISIVPLSAIQAARLESRLAIAEAYKVVLAGLHVDLQDPNLAETPMRVADALLEMCHGHFDTQERIVDIMQAKFPAAGYDEMIIVRRIVTSGTCPHHVLPIRYRMAIGYIPDKSKFVIGLSKLARIAELLSARLVMQEQLVMDIAEAIDSNLKPMGVGVIAVGEHNCMSHRGIKQREADAVTTRLIGVFKEAPVRQEFLAAVGILNHA